MNKTLGDVLFLGKLSTVANNVDYSPITIFLICFIPLISNHQTLLSVLFIYESRTMLLTIKMEQRPQNKLVSMIRL